MLTKKTFKRRCEELGGKYREEEGTPVCYLYLGSVDEYDWSEDRYVRESLYVTIPLKKLDKFDRLELVTGPESFFTVGDIEPEAFFKVTKLLKGLNIEDLRE